MKRKPITLIMALCVALMATSCMNIGERSSRPSIQVTVTGSTEYTGPYSIPAETTLSQFLDRRKTTLLERDQHPEWNDTYVITVLRKLDEGAIQKWTCKLHTSDLQRDPWKGFALHDGDEIRISVIHW